jgi:hypothetical protein
MVFIPDQRATPKQSSVAAAIRRKAWNATPSPGVISAPLSIWISAPLSIWRRTAMKTMTFAALNSYVSEHPVVRPVNEIAVWTWIAGAILIVCVLAAVLSPNRGNLAGNSQFLLPPISQPAPLTTDIIADPSL